jgi:hypothetical protein
LTEDKRERLYALIQEQTGLLGYEADVLSAAFISGEQDCARASYQHTRLSHGKYP